MKTVDVVFLPFQEPTFARPGESIADGRKRSSGPVSPEVCGSKITDVEWDDRVFLARLEGRQRALRVADVDQALVISTVSAGSHCDTFPVFGQGGAVKLRYPQSDYIWDRNSIAAEITGKTILALTIGVRIAFLTMRERLVLCFGILRRKDDGVSFLHWERSQ